MLESLFSHFCFLFNYLDKMSNQEKIEMKEDVLGVVDSWLGSSDKTEEESNQIQYERRPQRLGLGAKYVPHKKVRFQNLNDLQEETPKSILQKKLNREKRRKREKNLEERDERSDSDSDEEMQSKAKMIKSKAIQKNKIIHEIKNDKFNKLTRKEKGKK